MLVIAALLGSAAAAPPPRVAPPPVFMPAAPPVPPFVPLPPATSDAEVWALATRSGTRDGYFVYLDRFPNGAHVNNAMDALRRLGVVIAPPPPIMVAPAPVPAPARDPCIDLIADQHLGLRDTPEARAYRAARRSNRVSAYRAFLAAMPHGACAVNAQQHITSRIERRAQIKDIPGFGPLPAKLLQPRTIEEDDYPPLALRKEQQGVVTLLWEVAEDGIVEDCRVTASSGHAELDEGTCELVTGRFRYDPARDATGRVVRSVWRQTFRWQIAPDPPPLTPPPGA